MQESDAAPLVTAQVDDHAVSRLADHLESALQLYAAVAAQ